MSVSFPIIVNKSNLIPNSQNTYVYDIGQCVDMSNIDIALGSASIYFSWPNITLEKQNNKFSIIMPTLAGSTTINITIPDGGYSIDDLNNYLRYIFILNGWYIQNNSTQEQIVYAEFRVNPSIYAIEFYSYPLPTSLPSGYTAGFNITFPATPKGPQLIVTQANFGNLIGFELGTFPSSIPITLTTVKSTKTPAVNDITTVYLTCDAITNSFARNSNILSGISAAGKAYGSLITTEPYSLSWLPAQSGFRQIITISLVDGNMQPLNQIDTDVQIKILLRYRDQA